MDFYNTAMLYGTTACGERESKERPKDRDFGYRDTHNIVAALSTLYTQNRWGGRDVLGLNTI